ncbi:MAG: VWA domain-containing protein [candidate division Zixibacteria bacterium]|nr:VWA domain-containing protein [candidate division Zixibacteria bacterium]
MADCTTEISFELVSEGLKVEDIVVEAQRPKIDKFETSCVSRIDTKEIEALPVTDIQGIIKTQTGFVSEGGTLHARGSRKGGVIDGVLHRDQSGGYSAENTDKKGSTPVSRSSLKMPVNPNLQFRPSYYVPAGLNNEAYGEIIENEFRNVFDNPLSTFSIDVDAASYSNTRRFIMDGYLPIPNAVRIEEMINYFNYDYPQPDDDEPFAIITEQSTCPWNDSHRLVHIGLQGREVIIENMPSSNLVFLLDVSGSMSPANKLPLLKSSMKLLVDKLRPQDRVAIVVYASASGMVLGSTSGNRKKDILGAIDRLRSGGSTAGGAGISLAYDIAQNNFIKGGNNRVILATDGDFNVGMTNNDRLVKLIEEKSERGIFLTVLGFGKGNLKDERMETLADKGNGNYAYIDNILEAKKVLVNEMSGTLLTIAKDVKLQIEFNPVLVESYRLVGYENRILAKEDFNDDTKDAGELGAGHTVTALYEIVQAGAKENITGVDALKYQAVRIPHYVDYSTEMLTVKFRYKDPDGSKSKLIEHVLIDDNKALKRTSDNFRFSAAVAEFGMLLRDSKFKADASFDQVLKLAKKSKGEDDNGYRAEFIRLVETAKLMTEELTER